MIRTIIWQRLEPVTRTTDYDRALQASVHDPLWLLGRQWQFCEFQGEDRAAPVSVRAEVSSSPLARFRAANGEPRPYDPLTMPLEVLVEREPPGPQSLRAAAVAGRRLLALLREEGATQAAKAVVEAFPLPTVADAAASAPSPGGVEAPGPAAVAAVRLATVLHGRLPDGLAAAAALRKTVQDADGGVPKLPAMVPVPPGERAGALAAAQAFLAWLDAELIPAGAGSSWIADRFEYRFDVAVATAQGEVVLNAPEYRGGTLDWHDMAVDMSANASLGTPTEDSAIQPTSQVQHLLTAPVVFRGMPADRFWEIEDAAVNFASVQAAPEDLGRLALIEFATVFGNDWFVVPVSVPYGSVSAVNSLVVTDTFGESVLIEETERAAAARRATAAWRMFELSTLGTARGAGTPLALLLVPPVVTQSTEGAPIEDVFFLRDEQANLVWGIESVVEGADGRGRDRNDEWLANAGALSPPRSTSPAQLAYLLQTSVPEHWIPFVAVHDSAERRGVRLERAAMLRFGAGPPSRVQPVGRILEPETEPYVLFEEEVRREGVRLRRIPAVCRWLDGRSHAWISRRVTGSRGEESSGLLFDLARES